MLLCSLQPYIIIFIMLALIEFSESSRKICHMKDVLKREGNNCLVKYGGCKYEARLIASHASRKKLQKLKNNLEVPKKYGVPVTVPNTTLETSFSAADTINCGNLNVASSNIIEETDDSINTTYGKNDNDSLLKVNDSTNTTEQNSIVDFNSSNKEESCLSQFNTTDLGKDLKNNLLKDVMYNPPVNETTICFLEQGDLKNMDTSMSNYNLEPLQASSLFPAERLLSSSSTPMNDQKDLRLTRQTGVPRVTLTLKLPPKTTALNHDSSDAEYEDSDYEPEEQNSDDSTSEIESAHESQSRGGKRRNHQTEKSLDASGGMDVSMSVNVAGTTSCNDDCMEVESSRGRKGDKKSNVCFYCYKKQTKLARHLELKHSDQQDVQKFIRLPKKCMERRKIIEVLRKNGNFLFNTRTDLNDGNLIVTRRPNTKFNRSARDFVPCGNCKAFYAKSSIRIHFKACTGRSSKNNRIVMLMGKKILGRIHSRATETVRKELFPPLREDEVIRLIRYDELVIIYANLMCEKYKNPRFYEMIRQRIRLIGRFLLTMRKLNTEVSDLTSVYDPKFCDDVLNAINTEARLNENTKNYAAPSVASTLGTLLKQIGTILTNECIKKHDEVKQKNVKNFLKLLNQEVYINVNRTVVESQAQLTRRKKIELPSMDDIKKLHSYLSKKRNEAFEKLKESFSERAWIDLAEATLVSIQLFNRRRAGEVERILIDDFKTYQGINRTSDVDLFKSLSIKNQELAKKYVRFAIRGKLNRTVSVLLDGQLLQSVELLLSLRKQMKISAKNPYVFGLRGGDKVRHNYLRACTLVRKFSLDCGATNPERLRGTKLRKHIATTCISLNLTQIEVSDLANFMGHAEKIHKDIYRQPVVNREILQMSKLLEIAQGVNEEDNDNDESDTDEYNISNDIADERNSSSIQQATNSKTTEEAIQVDVSLPRQKSNNPELKKKKRMTAPYGSVKRTPWNVNEKEIVLRLFGKNLEQMKLPSLKEIHNAIIDHPCLANRTSPQIKTWLHNQTKIKRKLSFQD